jgi:protein-L-isoaspartate O-methyltransferase
MSSEEAAASRASFETRYRTERDPWNFATSPYERGRYREILRVLSRARYRYAFEPGCSVGELTVQLASRCDRVLATDVAPTAADRARRRCARWPNVSVACADLSGTIPAGPFDLIIFSEIGYYFGCRALAEIARRLRGALESGGEFGAVHWLGHSQDHALHGDVVHQVLEQSLDLERIEGRRTPEFRIDTWIRR